MSLALRASVIHCRKKKAKRAMRGGLIGKVTIYAVGCLFVISFSVNRDRQWEAERMS